MHFFILFGAAGLVIALRVSSRYRAFYHHVGSSNPSNRGWLTLFENLIMCSVVAYACWIFGYSFWIGFLPMVIGLPVSFYESRREL